MKRVRWATLTVTVLCLVAATIPWIFWPSLSGWSEANAAIRAIERFDLKYEIVSKRSYGVDTFTNDCSSQAIKDYYNRAAGALSTKGNDAKTLRWSDQMGWDRVSTVVQTTTGYVEVRASCNNDNDSVYIGFVPGRFEKPDAKLLAGHELPYGILRCDWKR